MQRPTLFLTIGLPGTGKTTAARLIEAEHKALRLTKDEWMKALFGPENPSSASDVIEGRLVQLGMRALELGINVVLDFGLWSRDERSALRQAAADIGASVVLCYFELAPDEQRNRLDERLADASHETWPISDDELAEFAAKFDVPSAAELDGSEPVGQPPDGFANWGEWRRHRWPPFSSLTCPCSRGVDPKPIALTHQPSPRCTWALRDHRAIRAINVLRRCGAHMMGA